MVSPSAEFDDRLRRLQRQYNYEWRRQYGYTFTALVLGALGRQVGFAMLLTLAVIGTKVGLALSMGEPALNDRRAQLSQGDVIERSVAVLLTPDPASRTLTSVITYVAEMEIQPTQQ